MNFTHFFRTMPTDLRAHCLEQTIPAHTIIFHSGDDAYYLYFLLDGQVKVTFQQADSHSSLLGVLRSGDVFGEVELLAQKFRSANVTTLQRSRVILIPKHDFLAWMQADSQFALAISRQLANKLATVDQYRYLNQSTSLEIRMLQFMVDYWRTEQLPLTKPLLIEAVGSQRRCVNRVLQKLIANDFLVSKQKNELLPVDVLALLAYFEQEINK